MIKAVLFDFNGVLLQDRMWQEEAWNELSKFLRGKDLTSEEQEQYVHGRIPQDTLAFLLGHTPSEKEVKEFLDNRKEDLYQKIALGHEDFKLTEGAVEFFEFLEKSDIKKTIATSSPLILISFYYKHLGLEKWFPFEDTVFSDGSFSGKPAPDIYLKAADKLNVDIGECMVIEDAKSGIESAQKAGAGKIVLFVNKDNEKLSKEMSVSKTISSFGEINLNDFS